MKRSSLSLLAALAATPALHAQCDFGARTFTFPSTVLAVQTRSDNPNFLVQTADVNRIWGGSIRPLRITELFRPNPILPVGVGRIPLVVTESGTGNYYGLNVRADFVQLALSAPATQVITGQEIVMLEGDGQVHVFGHWLDAWTSTPVNGPVSIYPGRALIIAADGNSRLLGYSWFGGTAPSIYTIPATGYASHIQGTGEPDSRRNSQAFETDTREITIYSPYTDGWHVVNTVSEARNVTVAYDKNVVLMQDSGANEFIAFSSITGTHVRFPVADAANATWRTQDFGSYVIDNVTGNTYLQRAIDGGLVTWPGVGGRIGTGGSFANNHWTIPVLDETTQQTDFHGCSLSVRGAQFVAAGAAGENVVRTSGNDNTFVLVTDLNCYGFSAFTNRWTKLSNYQGGHVRSEGEDFIGYVETTSHIYVYSPREDRWHSHVKGPGYAGFRDSDLVVAIDETSRKVAYSTDGVAFVSQDVSGAKLTDFNSNSYHCAIHDNDTTGGTTVHFFQGFGDRFVTHEISRRITATNTVQSLEDSVIIEDDDRIHVLSAFGDLTSQWGAPNDNYAWHAIPGVQARFFAAGPANAPAVLLLGVQRVDIPLGFCNPLQIDPALLIAVPMGTRDNRGDLRFDLTMPTGTGVVRMQMVSLSSRLEVGRALTFEIY